MKADELGLETRAIHAGRIEPRVEGASVTPIFQSAVWEHHAEGAGYHDVRYPRLSNLPNHTVLGRRLAALEGGEAGLVAGSGMAAISTALLALLGEGGHLLIQDQLYGGTHAFVTKDLTACGQAYDFVGPSDSASWKAKLRPNTRVIYFEAMTNPLLRVADHRAVVACAREHRLVSLIDSTFTTPVLFRPLELGYDVVLHSCTKYLNGHSDLVAGAAIGSAALVQRIKTRLDHLGGALDPHACFLLERGLKTLVLRVRRQCDSALTLARRLASHPGIARVNYAGLESHPDHARALELFSGFGGMLSFVPQGGVEAARRLLARLEIPTHGPSLGGVETLVTRPATTSHASLTADERTRVGIEDALIRVSVGIESVEDLIRDFEQALA